MKELIENAFVKFNGKVYLTEEAVSDLLDISNDELIEYTLKVMEKNKDIHEIYEKDGRSYYSLNSVVLIRNESSNKADIEIFKLSGKFSDAEEILLNEVEKKERNENALATLFIIIIIFFIGYFIFGSNSDKKEETKPQIKQVEQHKIEKTPEQIQSEKEEAERAALQKKYDDQKKYEEWIEYQKQQEAKQLVQSEQSVYKWCYNIFDSMGFSDDLLQYHMSNGSNESMKDLRYVSGAIYNNIKNETIPSDIPSELKSSMQKAQSDLMMSVKLRQQVAEKLLGNQINRSVDDMLNESEELKNSVRQQLVDIQEKLPSGARYYDYIGIYDPNN